jgi:hypothetical protein
VDIDPKAHSEPKHCSGKSVKNKIPGFRGFYLAFSTEGEEFSWLLRRSDLEPRNPAYWREKKR